MENPDFIKKLSFQLFEIRNELLKDSKEINLIEISNKLKKIDIEMLKNFNVKLSEKEKKSALEFINLMK